MVVSSLIADDEDLRQYTLIKGPSLGPGSQASILSLSLGHPSNLSALPKPVNLWREAPDEGLNQRVEAQSGTGATFGRKEEEEARNRRIQRARERDPKRKVDATLHMTSAAATSTGGVTHAAQHFVGSTRVSEGMKYYYLVADENDSSICYVYPVDKYYHVTKARKADIVELEEVEKLLMHDATPIMVQNALRRKKREAEAENEAMQRLLDKSMREGAGNYYNEGENGKGRGETAGGALEDGNEDGDADADAGGDESAGLGGASSRNRSRRYLDESAK